MAKTIVVHVEQIIDGEVLIDSDHTYYSEEEFEKDRQEAIDNWKDMQGDAAEIGCFGEVCETGTCLEMKVDGCGDYEKWSVVTFIGDKANLWGFGNLSTAIQCASALVGEARASHKKIPYERIGYALRTILKDISDAELGKQLATLGKQVKVVGP